MINKEPIDCILCPKCGKGYKSNISCPDNSLEAQIKKLEDRIKQLEKYHIKYV